MCRNLKKSVLAPTDGLSCKFSISYEPAQLATITSNVYSFVLAFFLVTCSSVSSKCLFAEKTRNSKEVCYGNSRPLAPALARAANLSEQTLVCLRHHRSIERQDSRCSSPFQERHSKKLTLIPVSLYSILYSQGKQNPNYQPESKWCNACKVKFYKNAQGDCGMAITKRRKVNLIDTLC